MKWINGLGLAVLATLLAACSSTTGSGSGASKGILNAQGSWKSGGKLQGGNLDVAYDTGSIKRTGDLATVRSRILVSNMNKESFLNTPHYKTAVSEWEMNCRSQTARLKRTYFVDDKQNLLLQHDYNAQKTPAAKPQSNTPVQTLWQVACNA